jgi:hypothetical protein
MSGEKGGVLYYGSVASVVKEYENIKKTERFDDVDGTPEPVMLSDRIELPRVFAGRRAAAMEAMTNACCGD